jgi:Sec-independent protein translocase protein TatA
LLIIVLLVWAKRLPEFARGSGRTLRIFKAETKGLLDDDDDDGTKRDRSTHETAPPRTPTVRLATCLTTRAHPALDDDEPAPVSLGGVFELFRGRPRDPIGEGGRMSLGDHFRELRARVMREL